MSQQLEVCAWCCLLLSWSLGRQKIWIYPWEICVFPGMKEGLARPFLLIYPGVLCSGVCVCVEEEEPGDD